MPIDPSRIGKPVPLGSHTTQRATIEPTHLGHSRSSPSINVPYAGIPGGRKMSKTGDPSPSPSSTRPRPRALSKSSAASFVTFYAPNIPPSPSSPERASTASIYSIDSIPSIPSPPPSPLPEVKPPQGTSDSVEPSPLSRISRGCDVKFDMRGPLGAYECLEESIRSEEIYKLYRNGLNFIQAIKDAVSKAEKGVLEDVLRSVLSDRSNVVFPLEAFKDWLESFPRKAASNDPISKHRLVSGARQETIPSGSFSRGEIVTFTKHEEAEMLEGCQKYIDFIYSGLKIYLRALMEDSRRNSLEDPEAKSGSVLDKALEPREEAAVEAVKAWKLNKDKLVGLLKKGLKIIASLPPVRFPKQRLDPPDDQTTLGSRTLVSIPDTLGTESTATTSFDQKTFKKMSLRASVLIIDSLGTGSSTGRTRKGSFSSDIWTDKNATLTQVILRLTDQTFAHANDLHEVLDTFWMFFHDFTDSSTLATTLIALYNSQNSQDVSGSAQQFHIAKLLRSWVEYHWCHSDDHAAFDVLHNFLREATAIPNKAVASPTNIQTLHLLHYIHVEKPERPRRLDKAIRDGTIAPFYEATGFDSTPIVAMQDMFDIYVLKKFHAQKEAGWEEFARALTDIESGFFLSFLPAHVSAWRGTDGSDSMKKWTTFANSLSLWAYKTTVSPRFVKDRAEMLNFWINVAAHCKQLRNYSSAYHIVLVLNSRLREHMKSEFKLIPAACNARLDALREYFLSGSFPLNYRGDLVRVSHPAVPIPGLVQGVIISTWEHPCCIKGSILDPVSGQEETIIPLAFYRKIRGLVKDLESCHRPYELTTNPLVYDYIQCNCEAFNKRDFDTAVNRYIEIAIKQAEKLELPERPQARGQAFDKQGRPITWDYHEEALCRKAGQKTQK